MRCTARTMAVSAKSRMSTCAEAGDRRNQLVHLTADGEALFHRLRAVAQTFDAVLRGDLTDQETATLITLLGKVERNLPVD